MELTYASYLRIPELLSLQVPESDGPEHDEMLFIIIHQVYELWFKQQIHETEGLRKRLDEGDLDGAASTLDRILTILKTMVKQIDVLETMTPVSFLSFRSFLANSSGFQSAQFREWEFMLGYKRPGPLKNYAADSPEHAALERRLADLEAKETWKWSTMREWSTVQEEAKGLSRGYCRSIAFVR